MYSFSLENQFNKVFAVIEYEEEYSFQNLYEKDIFFIKTIMELDRWENLSDKDTKNQLQLIYKLIAIISYALENDCSLYGSGD